MPKTKVNDLEMYYEIEGEGAPVVLLGGLTQDHLGWALQVPALVAAGYRCITPDNRDAGQTAQSPSTYGVRQMADDTVGLMDALGISSAHIVGLSMGGMIGQEMAINYPTRVSSLTLVCTGAAIDPDTLGIMRAWRAARPHCNDVDFTLMLSSWLLTYRFFQQLEAVKGFLGLVSSNPFPQSVTGFQRQCDAVMWHDTRDRVSRITAPTHVIVGSEDNLTPPRLSRWLTERIPGATLTEVPNAPHVLSLETPDAFNAALLQFLNAHVGSEAAPV
jgi:pimeloyl-ACP methyl ester carboxylesterase